MKTNKGAIPVYATQCTVSIITFSVYTTRLCTCFYVLSGTIAVYNHVDIFKILFCIFWNKIHKEYNDNFWVMVAHDHLAMAYIRYRCYYGAAELAGAKIILCGTTIKCRGLALLLRVRCATVKAPVLKRVSFRILRYHHVIQVHAVRK